MFVRFEVQFWAQMGCSNEFKVQSSKVCSDWLNLSIVRNQPNRNFWPFFVRNYRTEPNLTLRLIVLHCFKNEEPQDSHLWSLWLIQCSFGQECNFTYWSNEYHPFKLGKYSLFKENYYAKLLHLWLKWVKNCATKLAKFCHSLGETELTKHWQKVRPNFGRTESSVDH